MTDMQVQGDTSTSQLLSILNERLVNCGKKPLKGWSQSKAKLVERIMQVGGEPTPSKPEPEPEVQEPEPEDETQGTNPEDDVGFHSTDPTTRFTHDDAIAYIRRHRRRRNIHVRVYALVDSGFRDFHSAAYIKVSAKQARSVVTMLVGKDSTFSGHTITLRIDPPSVPPGSKHKGNLYVG